MQRNVLVTVLCVCVLLVSSTLVSTANNNTYRYLDLFGDVFEQVRSNYVEEISDKELIEAAIGGMLGSLDPHSAYLSPEDMDLTNINARGEFGGLGIEVTMEEGLVKVVSPIDDTPAFRAGLKASDYITHIDGEPVLGMNLQDAVDLMRGEVGTDIVLTVVRKGVENAFDVRITRAIIKIRSVRWRMEDQIGYIRLTSFTKQTIGNLEEAMDGIHDMGGDRLQGIVLDLRNNPGGLLEQAVAVADAFLEHGEIVSTKGRQKNDARHFFAEEGDLADGLNVVVLINGGSASASEIVAGALQDHKRALIMGTQSFGKGSVQTIVPLSSQGGMRLTTSRYFTPSGLSIQATGITPDLLIEEGRYEVHENAFISEADLRNSLDADDNTRESSEDLLESDTDAFIGSFIVDNQDEPKGGWSEYVHEDYQLLRALELLKGISLSANLQQ